MSGFPEVGAIVRLEARPDWGAGQIQSVVGARVTVNFEHAGKVVIDTSEAALTVIDDDWL
jgi:hypothetical protein